MTPIPLARIHRNTRILISLFLLSTLAGLAVAALNVYDKVGRIPHGVIERYGPDRPTGDTSGPILEEGQMIVARMNTFSQLLDVTHAHAFELPMVLFVLAHFLMRTRTPEWVKLTNYFVSFGGVFLFLSAPWVVRYWTLNVWPLFFVGSIAVFVSGAVMAVIPLIDMWCAPTKAGQA